MTDDLVMGAIYQHNVCTAVVEALNAGVDLLLVAFDGAQFYRIFTCASEALVQGKLDPATLREARAILADCEDTGRLPELIEQAELRLRGRAPGPRRKLAGDLSDRELAVLRLLPGEASLREIASDLYLSLNTVKTHSRSIYRKLDASSREQAVARARELGLLEQDPQR